MECDIGPSEGGPGGKNEGLKRRTGGDSIRMRSVGGEWA